MPNEPDFLNSLKSPTVMSGLVEYGSSDDEEQSGSEKDSPKDVRN